MVGGEPSMSWETGYSHTLRTADDSLCLVQSGMRVYIQPGCAEPERAKAMIEIADPRFREELYEYCEKIKWLHRPQLSPADTTGSVFRQ